jgi:hypothetical protein
MQHTWAAAVAVGVVVVMAVTVTVAPDVAVAVDTGAVPTYTVITSFSLAATTSSIFLEKRS